MREARARVLNGGLSCSAAAQEDSEFGVKKVHVVVDGEIYVEFLKVQPEDEEALVNWIHESCLLGFSPTELQIHNGEKNLGGPWHHLQHQERLPEQTMVRAIHEAQPGRRTEAH